MANNPVQIILNHDDFLRAPEPGTMGPGKDFFEGADRQFQQHKGALIRSMDGIRKLTRESKFGPATYIRVQMRADALAKSYRPNKYLFIEDQFPCVGAGGVGTIYFRAPLIYQMALRGRMEEAEVEVEERTSTNTGKRYKAPTRARLELGAIESIEIAPIADKRDFSVAAAIELFKDPTTVSGYQIELFETPRKQEIADDPLGRQDLLESLKEVLLSLGSGSRSYLFTEIGRTPVIELQLTESEGPALVDNRLGLGRRDVSPLASRVSLDFDEGRHEAALSKLVEHPLVRTIRPPMQLRLADEGNTTPTQSDTLDLRFRLQVPVPSQESTYPIVGVIDSGVASVLEPWIVERFDFLNESEYDPLHGTEVAGLITMGQTANDENITAETNGCMIYDAPLFPSDSFLIHYPNGFSDFLEELEQVVAEASTDHGVKVFNMSINAVSHVEPYRYSIYAAQLDRIADTYGAVFVNSAGNLEPSEFRAPWPKRPGHAVRYFASRTQSDTIRKPAESVRSISVGALNPPATKEIEDTPTVYTRRGPGLQVGVKPDVAHYGGTAVASVTDSSGLASIDPDGMKVDVMGTSFAAPLVARTLAGLDRLTQGGLRSEALRAMLLHSTSLPDPLTKRGLKDLARQFAGFGQPSRVADMLETDDHQITLVFQSRLSVGERKPAILRFPFDWPRSLVTENGACSGLVKITLVYSPPLDPAFGAEFVRVNLEAGLLQRQARVKKDGTPSYTNQIAPKYLPRTTGLGVPEKALIDHGLKWWPSKQYESSLDKVGNYSNWRVEVRSLLRAESQFPSEGIPFALLLTIEDPEGRRPIFQEMRQALRASKANAQDIRTAIRLRPR